VVSTEVVGFADRGRVVPARLEDRQRDVREITVTIVAIESVHDDDYWYRAIKLASGLDTRYH
jgi:hypothetical protein